MKQQISRLPKTKRNILFAYSWSLPSLLLISLIVIFPILYTGYISLTNMNIYHWTDYTIHGLENYKDALFVLDNGFIAALQHRECALSVLAVALFG